jgi:ferredoxin-NADP reductase
MKVTLVQIDHINHDVRTFWFMPVKNFGYTAGQFIELYLPHPKPDDRGEKRWFTLSSSPTEELLSVTTKFAKKSSSFKQVLHKLQIGDQVDISEPMGDFVLPKDVSIPLVFVAGGIGVTPLRSMAKYLIDTGEKRSLQVILAANATADVVFDDVFKKYGVEPTLVISSPTTEWSGRRGRLSAKDILEIIGESYEKRIYLSGPEEMVEVLDKDLKDLGLESSQIVGDFFPGYTAGI